MGLKAVIPGQGGGGLNPIVDSLTINGVDNAALATDENGLVYGVTGSSGDVMRLSGTGGANLYNVTYTGTRYVAVSDTGLVFTSTTGSGAWTRRATASPQTLLSVAWSGSLLVACGTNGDILTSPDGITWTVRTSGVATNLSSVTWDANNSQWVIVGSVQTVLTSPDGITWTARTYGTTNTIRGVAAGASVLVAVGASGVIKTSPTGVTWTSRTSGVATEIYGVNYDSTNTQFVAVGASGVILTSPDGTTWTARTSGVSTFLRDVTWGNSLYTAVGASGVVLTSPTGVTWAARTSGVSTELYSVITASTPLFVAVGVSGVRITSTNATTWTTVSQLVWVASTPSGSGSLLAADGASATNFTLSDLTASLPVATNASKKLITSPVAGTGSTVSLYSSGSFTATLSGVTTTVTGTVMWSRSGNIVTLTIPSLSGTSNSSAGNITGLPVGLTPIQTLQVGISVFIQDNSNQYSGIIAIKPTGLISFVAYKTDLLTGAAIVIDDGGFTSSGTKGCAFSSITYSLD